MQLLDLHHDNAEIDFRSLKENRLRQHDAVDA
jgi:hypothetical protein